MCKGDVIHCFSFNNVNIKKSCNAAVIYAVDKLIYKADADTIMCQALFKDTGSDFGSTLIHLRDKSNIGQIFLTAARYEYIVTFLSSSRRGLIQTYAKCLLRGNCTPGPYI